MQPASIFLNIQLSNSRAIRRRPPSVLSDFIPQKTLT